MIMLAVMRFCNPKPSKLLVDTYALYDEESQGIFRVVPIYFPIPVCYNCWHHTNQKKWVPIYFPIPVCYNLGKLIKCLK